MIIPQRIPIGSTTNATISKLLNKVNLHILKHAKTLQECTHVW